MGMGRIGHCSVSLFLKNHVRFRSLWNLDATGRHFCGSEWRQIPRFARNDNVSGEQIERGAM
jgi:hypothetical protein